MTAPQAETLHVILPGCLSQKTGGYYYDARIIAGLGARGWPVIPHELPGGFPAPSPASYQAAASYLAALPANSLVVVDGLALGVLPDLAQRHSERLRLVGLVHHPLAAETGLSADRRRALQKSERRALEAVRGAIVTSPFTARALVVDYGLPERAVAVVEPGFDPAPLAVGSGSPLTLLCVATLIPRKGHALLIEALASLRHLSWQLRCVGGLHHSPATVASVEALIEQHRLQGRILLLGERSGAELEQEYHRADLFVLASHYEGYGMAPLEAMARGLPLVVTIGGALADTVPVEAAERVPTNDVTALTAALEAVLCDEARRQQLAAGARRRRRALATWEQASERFAAALKELAQFPPLALTRGSHD